MVFAMGRGRNKSCLPLRLLSGEQGDDPLILSQHHFPCQRGSQSHPAFRSATLRGLRLYPGQQLSVTASAAKRNDVYPAIPEAVPSPHAARMSLLPTEAGRSMANRECEMLPEAFPAFISQTGAAALK